MPQIQTPQGVIELPYGDEPAPDLSSLLGGQQEQPSEDGASILRELLQLLDRYKAVERDEEDLLAAEQVGTLVQKLLAKQQKEADDMLQGKLSPSALRRLG